MHLRALLSCVVIASTVPACGGGRPATTAESEVHATRGTIVEDRDGRVLVIDHDEIPGYMRAMTMPFEIETKRPDLAVGDHVRFTFVETDEGRRIIRSIEKVK